MLFSAIFLASGKVIFLLNLISIIFFLFAKCYIDVWWVILITIYAFYVTIALGLLICTPAFWAYWNSNGMFESMGNFNILPAGFQLVIVKQNASIIIECNIWDLFITENISVIHRCRSLELLHGTKLVNSIIHSVTAFSAPLNTQVQELVTWFIWLPTSNCQIFDFGASASTHGHVTFYLVNVHDIRNNHSSCIAAVL